MSRWLTCPEGPVIAEGVDLFCDKVVLLIMMSEVDVPKELAEWSDDVAYLMVNLIISTS